MIINIALLINNKIVIKKNGDFIDIENRFGDGLTIDVEDVKEIIIGLQTLYKTIKNEELDLTGKV